MKKQRILVVGGSRGIGAAAVQAYRQEGHDVAFLYNRSKAEADALSETTGAVAVSCDVQEKASVEQGVQEALVRLGVAAFDVCVYNAGISEIGLLTDLPQTRWEALRNTNLDGCLYVLQAVIPGMVSAKTGSIVLMSSMWGRCGASCEAAYSATKAGILGLGKSLAKELGPSGIRVNCVCPGVIDTDMNADLTKEDLAVLCEETPLGRIGKPEEVADLLLFLTSDKASFITGQVIGIDGGFVV